MPSLLEWNGYRFFLYSNEGELHKLPNLYVQKSESEIEFVISNDEDPKMYLKRSHGFSVEEIEEVISFAETWLKDIRKDWYDAFC